MADTDPAPSKGIHRLNGWKEIASFLGKGVRTVQRWEKELGLPVRRIGKDGEIVFALKSEIEAWLAGSSSRANEAAVPDALASETPPLSDPAPDASPAPVASRQWSFGRRSLGITAASVLVLGGLWIAVRGTGVLRARDVPRPVTAVRLQTGRLIATDAANRPVWTHDFPGGLPTDGYNAPDARNYRPAIVVEDFDRDGLNEVVFAASGGVTEGTRSLYGFNDDGSARFVYQPSPTVHFGSDEYAPHWQVWNVFTTRDRGVPSIWTTFIHDRWFPTLVTQLSDRGIPRSQFWSNGYISFIQTAAWRGRDVVLLGGTNNEHRAGALAIFEGLRLQGSSPASDPKYKCVDCGDGGPAAFLVFPRTCMRRRTDGQPVVDLARIDGKERIVAIVDHGNAVVAGADMPAHVYYTFRPDLTLERIELSREFLLVHAALEREGKVDHAYGAQDEKDFFPVLRWDGGRFVPLPPAPVVR